MPTAIRVLTRRPSSSRTPKRQVVPAELLVELQPDRKLSRHLSIAFDRQRCSRDLMPMHVPEIKPDKDGNIAANGQIDGISRILEADVSARPLENQPNHAQ